MATPGTVAALADEFLADLDRRLAAADADLAARYPGDPGTRQPVHTVYVPADRFDADTAADWGRAALAALEPTVPTPTRSRTRPESR